MPNKPPIYAHCPAGCEWETVHKSDFDAAVTCTRQVIDSNNSYLGDAIAKYRISADILGEGISDIDISCAAFDNPCSCVVGKKLYVFSVSGHTNQVLILDMITNVSEILSLGDVDLSNSCCAAFGNDIYIFGGTADCSTRVLKFDTLTNTLTTTSTVFSTARKGGCAVSNGLYISICGGYNGTTSDANVYRMTSAGVLSVLATTDANNMVYSAAVTESGVFLFGTSKMYKQTFSGLTEVMTVSTSNELLGMKPVGIRNKIYCINGTGDWANSINIIDVSDYTASPSAFGADCTTFDCVSQSGAYAYLVGIENNKIKRYNIDTYDVRVSIDTSTSGVSKRRELPITVYDTMRGYFYFEILNFDLLTVTYEENGERVTSLYEGGLVNTAYRIVIDGATQIDKVSELGGLTINVDEWTGEVINSTAFEVINRREYRGTGITELTLTYPEGIFECWLRLTFAASGTIAVTFPQNTQYIGTAPTFANGETWEVSIKDGVVIAAKVGDGT